MWQGEASPSTVGNKGYVRAIPQVHTLLQTLQLCVSDLSMKELQLWGKNRARRRATWVRLWPLGPAVPSVTQDTVPPRPQLEGE